MIQHHVLCGESHGLHRAILLLQHAEVHRRALLAKRSDHVGRGHGGRRRGLGSKEKRERTRTSGESENNNRSKGGLQSRRGIPKLSAG